MPACPGVPRETALYAFTRQGLALAAALTGAGFAACLYVPVALQRFASTEYPDLEAHPCPSLSEHMGRHFSRYRAHVFISATGIAVRAIAPHLAGKCADPAVVVLDQRGQYVISLLSGHIGKGNALTRRIAGLLGAQAVVSTGTDVEGLPAIDELARDHGLFIANPPAIKEISAALLRGDKVFLHDPEDFLRLSTGPHASLFVSARAVRGADTLSREPAVVVSEYTIPFAGPLQSSTLLLRPPVLCAGIGCRRGVSTAAVIEALCRALDLAGLAAGSLACLASIAAKEDEAGLLLAARQLGVPFFCFSASELGAFPVSAPSSKVMEQFGIGGVCEPAALAACFHLGGKGRLLLAKQVAGPVTVALARMYRAL